MGRFNVNILGKIALNAKKLPTQVVDTLSIKLEWAVFLRKIDIKRQLAKRAKPKSLSS